MKIPKLRYAVWTVKANSSKTPIVIIATLNGKRKYFATSIAIENKYIKGKEIDKKAPNYTQMDMLLRKHISDLERQYLEAAARGNGGLLSLSIDKSTTLHFYDAAIECFDSLKNKATPAYISNCKSVVKEFCEVIGDVLCLSITAAMLQKYENYLYGKGIKPTTINRRFKWLKQVANYCDDMYNLTIKAFKLYKHTKWEQPVRKPLTEAQVKAIEKVEVSGVEKLIKDAFLIGCYTGLRYSDILNFDYNKNVLTADGVKRIVLHQTKTAAPVVIKISEKVDLMLQGLQKLPTNKHVNFIIRNIAKKAGIETNIHFHISRHSFATILLNKGGRIEAVSKLLGHTDIKTTQIYAKVANITLDNTMDLLS